MKWVVLGILAWVILLGTIALSSCTTHANLRYSCDGPCSGSLTRDTDLQVDPKQTPPKGK